MLSAAQHFTYFTHTERRASYCEYKGVTYEKGAFIEKGKSGEVHEFTATADQHEPVVVKRELPCEINDQVKYPYGEEFEDEARYAQYFLPYGAFAGDADNDNEPHYTLLAKVPGQRLSNISTFPSATHLLQALLAILEAIRLINEHELLPCAHGDAHLENFMLHYENGVYSVKLVDFGRTNEVGVPTTRPSRKQPLPPHMAPELKDSVDAHPNQDIWAAGYVYKTLTTKAAVTLNDAVHTRLTALSNKMLSPSPAERPMHRTISTELLDLLALQQASDETPTSTRRNSFFQPMEEKSNSLETSQPMQSASASPT